MRHATRAAALAGLLGLAGLAAGRGALGAERPGAAGEPTASSVTVVLDSKSLAVGDPVTATLTLALAGADANREATFPDWSKGWGDAEVLSASAVERAPSADGVRLVQRVKLAAFRPGTTALPPVEVRLSGEPERRIATPQKLALEVRSVIPPDDKELKAAPPSPPRALSVPRSFWWTLAGGSALAALAALLAWRRRSPADLLAAPELSPGAELERALALLAVEPPAAAFRLLSQALRRYLGRQLAFHALESTTTEIQRKLAARRFDPALVQGAVKLLRLADQIKFALRPVELAEVATRVAETRALAIAVEEHLAPVSEGVPTRPSGTGAETGTGTAA